MIRIRAELLPGGREDKKQHLGTIIIANDGSGTSTRGNYNVVISKRGKGGLWKKCTVENFPRKKLGVWDLLFSALCSFVPDRTYDQGIGFNKCKSTDKPDVPDPAGPIRRDNNDYY